MTLDVYHLYLRIDVLKVKGGIIEPLPDFIKEFRYSPDQPHDDHGRWTSSGSKGLTSKRSRVKIGHKERKLVTSEINTYYHSRYEGKKMCRYYSGIYSKTYVFENHGYSNYRFIKVSKIK